MTTAAPRRCCVIGGAGFIGRPVVQLLKEAGREVVIIDRGPAPAKEVGVTYYQGDYTDRSFLETVLADVDEVIHLAYASIPKTSFDDPFADLLQNVPPALVLFDVAAAVHVRKLVVISSGGTVYGHAQSLPISETHPTNPISPYGITKLAIEKYAGLYFELKGLPVVVVRPANAYGEEQRPFTGQGFIATAVASVLQGKEITVFGETGGIRDYIHVQDIASGIVAALEYGTPGECYNLGTGVGTSTKEIIEKLGTYAQAKSLSIHAKYQPARKFDVVGNILDITKITQETGWKPTITLDEGLQKTWEYHVAQPQV